MIDNIKINYTLKNGSINVTLSIKDTDNLPYDLAEMFIKVIDDSNVSPKVVIDELIRINKYK